MKTSLATAFFLMFAAPAIAGESITVFRDPTCGCCNTYIAYLKANGFEVQAIDDPKFEDRAIAAGVPANGLGCHLAMINGYAVSGLVPVEIIQRLISDKPDIAGITLPGMPANAPGMARSKSGTLKIYAFGPNGVRLYSEE